jgi:hypothetical protein
VIHPWLGVLLLLLRIVILEAGLRVIHPVEVVVEAISQLLRQCRLHQPLLSVRLGVRRYTALVLFRIRVQILSHLDRLQAQILECSTLTCEIPKDRLGQLKLHLRLEVVFLLFRCLLFLGWVVGPRPRR